MIKRGKQVAPSEPVQAPLITGTDRLPDADELLKIDKMIRIAVSGDVFLTQCEREIIDTPDFQRLRGVRQLGSVVHVFPTALHTRFDHSLGTLAMANRMIDAIKNNRVSDEKERRIQPIQEVIARLYALLHDITHVPFGHTIEDELGILTRHDKNPKRILRFLGPDSAIGETIQRYIGPEGYGRFMAVYNWLDDEKERNRRAKDSAWAALAEWLTPTESNDDAFIHDVVSNTVCADLLDYVARDSYFCNLDIGLEYRFINFLYLDKIEGSPFRRVFVRLWKGRHQAPRRDTMTDLARLLEARYMIAERAYFHHAKIISGAMLGRAVQEQLAAGLLTEEGLYDHTDETLLRTLRSSEVTVSGKLADALCSRKLHKLIGRPYGKAAFDAVEANDVQNNARDNALNELGVAASRRLVENELAERIGAEPGDVLIYAPDFNMNPKAAEMNVRWHGQAMRFYKIDDAIIRPRLKQIYDAHQLLWGIHFLASKEIAEEEDNTRRDLLKEAFEIEYLCHGDEQHARKVSHYAKIVEFNINQSAHVSGQYSDTRDGIRKAAESLLSTASDKRPFRERLSEAISEYVLS